MKRKEIITVRDVSFSYDGNPFLERISLSVYDDDFLGMIGPNGGGKTTLIKLILGILQPDSGEIKIFGKDPRSGRRDIGYLSQFENIDFDFPITVMDIVMMSRLGKGLFKGYSNEDVNATTEALKQMRMWELREKKLNELSGGEKHRVFVARALANKPKLLILDEPLANLDIHIQENFYELLKELNRSIAIVVVDHNLDMLSKYVKEVACINKCNNHGLRYHGLDTMRMKKVCEI
ncbi:MAG: ABC transporter ATP-binding protein [Candidatus Micrarchaeota archaeon]